MTGDGGWPDASSTLASSTAASIASAGAPDGLRTPDDPDDGPPGPVDRELADRITEAVLLAGLPVAFGGHGPGVHLRPARPLGDGDPCAGLVAVHWRPSGRLLAAAAMEAAQQPAFSARQVVTAAMENALAEFLPAFGLDAERHRLGWETRVGHAEDRGLRVPHGVPAPPRTGRTPTELGLGAGIVAAVRRSAGLAGLPVAGHTGAPGVTADRCPPSGAEDEAAAGTADIGWNPSRRLTDLAAAGFPASAAAGEAVDAVRAAMRHALGTVLGACGTDLWWARPRGIPAQLRAIGASDHPPIRR